MPNNYIAMPPDSTGKKLQTWDNIINSQDVHAEAVILVGSNGVEKGTSSNPVRIDPVGTTPQPISGSISVNNFPSIQNTQITSPVDGSGYVEVDLKTSLPAGSNTIGAVDIASGQTIAVTNTGTFATQATLQAGSALIGQVEVSDGTNVLFTPGHPGYVQGSVTISGTLTNNNAAPGTNHIGALTVLANAAPPTWNEGDEVLLSSDLSGNLRVSITGSVIANNDIEEWASTTLGAPTAFGTEPSGNVIGVNAELFQGSSIVGSGNALYVQDSAAESSLASVVSILSSPLSVTGSVTATGTIAATQGTTPWTTQDEATTSTGSNVPADAIYVGAKNTSGKLAGLLVDASGFLEVNVETGTITANIVGHAGITLDAVLGASKPANVLQVGGNDGTNAYAIPLASGGGSVEVTDTAGDASLSTIVTNTDPFVVSSAGGYIRQDSTGTIAKESGGNLATIAGAVTSSVMQENVDQWGGTAVTAAQQMAPTAGALVGTEEAPLIRPVQRKWTQILATSLPGGGTFTSSWFDSNADGALAVNVQVYPTQSLSSLNLQQTDDTTTSGNEFATAIAVNGSSKIQGLVSLTARYWRVVLINGATIQGAGFEITATAMSFIPSVVGSSGLPFTQESGNGLMGVGIISGSGVADNSQSYQVSGNTTAIGGNISALGMAVTTGSSANSAMLRTPAVFQGAICVGGVTTVWMPTVGKKARLMKYKLEAAEDVTYSTSATPIMLSWGWGLSATSAGSIPIQPTGLHRFVAPSSVLATSGDLYNSNWVDMGNGYINGTASQPVQLGLTVPQSTAAITPTFGLSTSEQWEATTQGFITVGGLGGAVLRQQWNTSSAGSPAAFASTSVLSGNTIIIVARVTNSASGTSVLSVSSETESNTYTVLAANSNASDGTHGSSLYIIYSINIKGGADTITLSGTNSPTEIQAIALEYQGITAIGATGQSATTGSSSAPSSGSYTPGEAGDLIITVAATASNGIVLSSQPTITTYTMRGTIFTAAGAIAVADNWGNGSLAAGGVNAIVIGTEE